MTRDAGGLRDRSPSTDPDLNVSTVAGCDEWFPNAAGETAPADDTQFQQQDPVRTRPHGRAARRTTARACTP